MAVVPGDIETDQQPPMAVPLRHFVVALVFLVAGAVLGVLNAVGAAGGLARVAQLHLLLVGWVCLTIMGAMTQFVPVWSGVSLHSRRLAVAQLWLTAGGLAGLVAAFLTLETVLFLPAGLALLAGIWTFVYNVGRTLMAVESFDTTEAHFGFALVAFASLAPLGVLLALSLRWPGLLPTARAGLVSAHATLAVFGAVLTTVVGALYQLSTMFTQTELHGADLQLQRYERTGYPLGVLGLVVGRLFGQTLVARIGAVLVTTGLLAVAAVLARRLVETRVDWTPMLSRYAVLSVTLTVWSLLALWAWLTDPLGRNRLLGAPGTELLLVLGVIGFVVLGTLYHIVPFVVWVHRYSDLLGFESVPMIDDLYDGRVAALDFGLFVTGVAALVVADGLGAGWLTAPGALALTLGTLAFAGNMLGVLIQHSPQSLSAVVFGRLGRSES
jgi:hypothetical protein